MKIHGAVLHAMGATTPYAQSKPLAIEAVELDAPGPGEVLVKIAAAGLCHSDLSVINGDRPRPMPMVLGHEAAGIVEATGAGVDDLQRGDHVVMVFVPSCGHCAPCAEGRPALCEPGAAANTAGTLLSGAVRLHRNGQPLYHHLGVLRLRRVRDGVAPLAGQDRSGAAAARGGAVRLRGADRRRRGGQHRKGRVPGRPSAVIGLGGVGLAAVLGAVSAGARRIVAIDLVGRQAATGEGTRRDRTLNAAAPDRSTRSRSSHARRRRLRVRDRRLGEGDGARLQDHAPRRHDDYRRPAAADPHAAAAARQPGRRGAHVKGSYIGTCVPMRDLPRYIALYRQGRLPVDRLLSGTAEARGDQPRVRSPARREGGAAGRGVRALRSRARANGPA